MWNKSENLILTFALSAPLCHSSSFSSASSQTAILLDDVQCGSNDLTLLSCQHAAVGSHNCDHSEDVVVYCDGSDYGMLEYIHDYDLQ